MLAKSRMLGGLFALSCCAGAMAASKPPQPLPAEQVQPATFATVVAGIDKEMQPNGRFLVNAQQRGEVDTDLAGMQQLLAGHSSLDELNADQRKDLFARQQRVDSLLAENDGDVSVCHRETKMGSHMTETVCTKRRDLKQQDSNAVQQQMRDMQMNRGH